MKKLARWWRCFKCWARWHTVADAANPLHNEAGPVPAAYYFTGPGAYYPLRCKHCGEMYRVTFPH